MSDTLVQETFDYMLAGAEHAIRQGGSFLPFAAGVRLGGERVHMNLEKGHTGAPVETQIGAVVGALRQDKTLTCAGMCFDGQVKLETGETVSAVVMHIEVRGGESLEAFVPYVREPRGAVFLQPIFAPSAPEFFVGP